MSRHLEITVFEPGETVATMSTDGHVGLWTVRTDGHLVRADSRLFGNVTGFTAETEIELLELTVRTYNLLKREGINTVGAMIDLYRTRGEDGLSDMRNMGQKSVAEIRDWVERLSGQEGGTV